MESPIIDINKMIIFLYLLKYDQEFAREKYFTNFIWSSTINTIITTFINEKKEVCEFYLTDGIEYDNFNEFLEFILNNGFVWMKIIKDASIIVRIYLEDKKYVNSYYLDI